jgi:hypothetical protein
MDRAQEERPGPFLRRDGCFFIEVRRMLSLHLLNRARGRPGRRQAGTRAERGRWELTRLEDRTVPAIGFATGAGPGLNGSPVSLYDTTCTLIATFQAYPGFGGGAHVALGDVNGDGVKDLITGAGAGGTPHVKVFDGLTLSDADPAVRQVAIDNPLKSFYAYAPTVAAGVNVAAGDINGDGTVDIVTGPGPGVASHVKVFNFTDLATLFSFYAYDPTIACGASVAAGNVGGDTGNPPIHAFPSDELITGAGPGGAPHVKVYSVSLTSDTSLDLLGQFYAYSPTIFNGVTVAAGLVTKNQDTLGNTYADIITGSGAGVPPTVEIFRLDNGQNPDPGFQFTFLQAAHFNAYSGGFTGGVNVAVTTDLDGDGIDDFITGAGPGGGPHVIPWGGKNATGFPPADLATYLPVDLGLGKYAFASTFTGGVNVG